MLFIRKKLPGLVRRSEDFPSLRFRRDRLGQAMLSIPSPFGHIPLFKKISKFWISFLLDHTKLHFRAAESNFEICAETAVALFRINTVETHIIIDVSIFR